MPLAVLQALQTLSDAGLVHRDVKPENILFFNGQPCLGDISLLGADASVITRRGTPGYATSFWYAAAAMLQTLLTGNSPEKLGRASFLWLRGMGSIFEKIHEVQIVHFPEIFS
jgi:serine/threonine-protein kinase